MKFVLMAVGRPTDTKIAELTDRYTERLRHYVPFETRVIPDIKGARKMTEAQQKEAEGRLLLEAIERGDYVILLDERGREYTSREFASLLDRKMSTVQRNVILVIGGPYGFAQSVYDRADTMLSMSRMTMTHEMIRLFVAEQMYRAMTILRGEPYHHD